MKLHYSITGNGTPLVLTSGLGGTVDDWEFLLEPLSRHFRVLSWDHRGHGRSDWSKNEEDYDPDRVSEDLDFTLRTAGASESTPGVLIGHSLGGYHSLRFALEYPQLVRALVLIATGPGFKNTEHRLAWNKRILSSDLGREFSPHARKLGVQKDAFVARNLARLDVPALIIVGERDRAFVNAHDFFMKHIKKAVSCVVDNAGHNLHKTHDKQVLNAVCSFLDKP